MSRPLRKSVLNVSLTRILKPADHQQTILEKSFYSTALLKAADHEQTIEKKCSKCLLDSNFKASRPSADHSTRILKPADHQQTILEKSIYSTTLLKAADHEQTIEKKCSKCLLDSNFKASRPSADHFRKIVLLNCTFKGSRP